MARHPSDRSSASGGPPLRISSACSYSVRETWRLNRRVPTLAALNRTPQYSNRSTRPQAGRRSNLRVKVCIGGAANALTPSPSPSRTLAERGDPSSGSRRKSLTVTRLPLEQRFRANGQAVEMGGFEPPTSRVQGGRSPSELHPRVGGPAWSRTRAPSLFRIASKPIKLLAKGLIRFLE